MKFNPIPHKVEKEKSYFWCSCGKSKKQPFCDGSHTGTDFKPLEYVAEKTETQYFCTCKKTKNKPLCDGSHNHLDTSSNDKDHFYAMVQPDKKEIEVAVNETILTASIRNNISHLSACGGSGKCSTCRVEIMKGLENCSIRSEAERKLSDTVRS